MHMHPLSLIFYHRIHKGMATTRVLPCPFIDYSRMGWLIQYMQQVGVNLVTVFIYTPAPLSSTMIVPDPSSDIGSRLWSIVGTGVAYGDYFLLR